MQPLHSPLGGLFPPYEANGLVSEQQIKTAFAWQTIRNSGAPLVFSTDWPVVPVGVMLSVKGAVHGAPLPAVWPDQRQSLRDTLASYTRDNAWVEFNEHRKGKLGVGMMADIVVMDANLESTATELLDQTRAAVTLCGGRVTHEA